MLIFKVELCRIIECEEQVCGVYVDECFNPFFWIYLLIKESVSTRCHSKSSRYRHKPIHNRPEKCFLNEQTKTITHFFKKFDQ